MRRKSCGWFMLVAFALYALLPRVSRVWAADTGDVVGLGTDEGDQVVKVKPREKDEGSIWPWVLGSAAAVAAAAAGYLLAADKSDDADASASDAQGSAALAEQSAAKAEAAATPAEGFKYQVQLVGEFYAATGDYSAYGAQPGLSFTPSITFRAPAGGGKGTVSYYNRSTDGTETDIGGDYEQVSDKSVLIRVNDVFYMGKATSLSEYKIRLANGIVLDAKPGAGVNLVPLQ